MILNFFTFSRFTLFVALCISAIAAYYSVIGLTAIFAGAVIPIIVMGSILEVAKITTTVWLHKNWNKASFSIKSYLTSAVIILACITSMGIFGLLSKAHSEQSVVKGGNKVQIAEIDRQIAIEQRNINDSIKVIAQLDQAVQALIDANRIRGSSGSIAVRKSQTEERNSLNDIIRSSNEKISSLEQQKMPLIQQQFNLEAEVGPIKYVAALIYGDNPDVALLERAVRWMIILLVLVFDPLAIVLILAANSSIKWDKESMIAMNGDDRIEPVFERMDVSESVENNNVPLMPEIMDVSESAETNHVIIRSELDIEEKLANEPEEAKIEPATIIEESIHPTVTDDEKNDDHLVSDFKEEVVVDQKKN